MVGRDPEFDVKGREVEKQKVARVIGTNGGIDLCVLYDVHQRLRRDEFAQKGETPMEGDGPSLVSGDGGFISLVDLERYAGLKRRRREMFLSAIYTLLG